MRARAVLGGGPLPVPGSKFGCPAVPVRAVARPRLAEVLAQPDWRVALVTGGPATGKTVAVAQWFQALGPVAREWVTLDAGDDRPERFWLTFALALDRAVPGAFAWAAAAAADVHRLPPGFLDRLLTAWSAVTEPLVLVLEDVHHLGSPEITADLGVVIEHLPGRSRMVLTSRVDPRLPVSRWRGRGWLAELRQRDLALTLPETAELFTALGEDRLAASDIERLWRHTEGWAAGLRLAAAALRDRADIPAAVAEFSGRTPVVADLLADELFRRAPRKLAEFLLRTSVADVLDAELCDALSGRSDSADVLRRMEADLQFVMATGPGRDTWRYHPLPAEMLRAELQAHRPDEAQELNRLAALLQARGDVAGAVRCLLAAGDTDRAFSIVFEAAHRRADVSDIPGIAAFLNLFPRELVTESAARMLTYALMLGLAGQVAEAHAWLQRAQMRISDQPQARAEDVATLDALRLLTFTVTAGAGDEIDAGRRAVQAVEAGLDGGVAGARARMNLVRGCLLVDQPGEAGEFCVPAARAMRSRRWCSRRRWPRASRCGTAASPKPDARLRLACRRLARSASTPTWARSTPILRWREFASTATSSRTRPRRSGAWRRFFRPTRSPASTRSCSSWRRPGSPRRWTTSTTCSLSCARPASSSITSRGLRCGA